MLKCPPNFQPSESFQCNSRVHCLSTKGLGTFISLQKSLEPHWLQEQQNHSLFIFKFVWLQSSHSTTLAKNHKNAVFVGFQIWQLAVSWGCFFCFWLLLLGLDCLVVTADGCWLCRGGWQTTGQAQSHDQPVFHQLYVGPNHLGGSNNHIGGHNHLGESHNHIGGSNNQLGGYNHLNGHNNKFHYMHPIIPPLELENSQM